MFGRLLNRPLKCVVKYNRESIHFFQQILGFLFKRQTVDENHTSSKKHVERKNTLNTAQRTTR